LGSSASFQDSLDDVRLSNRALSALEISDSPASLYASDLVAR